MPRDAANAAFRHYPDGTTLNRKDTLMATPIDKTIVNRIIERNEKNLGPQKAALKQTLDELDMLVQINTDGAYQDAVKSLQTKRDRQHSLVKSTEQAIAAYRQLLKR